MKYKLNNIKRYKEHYILLKETDSIRMIMKKQQFNAEKYQIRKNVFSQSTNS